MTRRTNSSEPCTGWVALNADQFEEDVHYWYDREKRKVDPFQLFRFRNGPHEGGS